MNRATGGERPMVQELKHGMLAAQDGDSCGPAAGPVLR
jgi:hypothetical protein